MSAFNIYFLRDIFNEQYDIDIEHTIECLKEDLKDYPSILEKQLEMVENCQRDGCNGLRDILVSITKSWLEVQSGKTQIKYYNLMVQEKSYDECFAYIMHEFWDSVRELGLDAEKIAEGIVRGNFRPWDNYALMDDSGRFYSSDYPEDLIGELEDIAEFMVDEDLFEEVG
jgi:hypothetical protein